MASEKARPGSGRGLERVRRAGEALIVRETRLVRPRAEILDRDGPAGDGTLPVRWRGRPVVAARRVEDDQFGDYWRVWDGPGDRYATFAPAELAGPGALFDFAGPGPAIPGAGAA